MIAIKKFREKKNMTQSELASKLGVRPTTVSMWESGDRRPNLVMLKKLSEILQCSVDALLEPIEI